MAINDILVFKCDSDWRDILERDLPDYFPDVSLRFAEDWNEAIEIARNGKRPDLYIVCSYKVNGSSLNSKDFRDKTSNLQSVDSNARIALFSAISYVEIIPEGVDFFDKSDPTEAFTQMKEKYS